MDQTNQNNNPVDSPPPFDPSPVPNPTVVTQAPLQQKANSDKSFTIITILLLLFFTPIGIILMWLKTGWSKWLKIVITIGFGLYIIFILLIVISLLTLNPQKALEKAKQVESSQNQESVNETGVPNDSEITFKDESPTIPPEKIAKWSTFTSQEYITTHTYDNADSPVIKRKIIVSVKYPPTWEVDIDTSHIPLALRKGGNNLILYAVDDQVAQVCSLPSGYTKATSKNSIVVTSPYDRWAIVKLSSQDNDIYTDSKKVNYLICRNGDSLNPDFSYYTIDVIGRLYLQIEKEYDLDTLSEAKAIISSITRVKYYNPEISIEKAVNKSKNPNMEVDIKKLNDTFAQGGAGTGGFGGFVWIAKNNDDIWKVIWSGNNSPSCKTMQEYSVPKEFWGTPDCSNNY